MNMMIKTFIHGGTTVRNLEDGVVIKVLKNEDGKICKDYYLHERFFSES